MGGEAAHQDRAAPAHRDVAFAIAAVTVLSIVMPGLDPGIHHLEKSWMAGSSPAMTNFESVR
jgi:hypothetical protein